MPRLLYKFREQNKKICSRVLRNPWPSPRIIYTTGKWSSSIVICSFAANLQRLKIIGQSKFIRVKNKNGVVIWISKNMDTSRIR